MTTYKTCNNARWRHMTTSTKRKRDVDDEVMYDVMRDDNIQRQRTTPIKLVFANIIMITILTSTICKLILMMCQSQSMVPKQRCPNVPMPNSPGTQMVSTHMAVPKWWRPNSSTQMSHTPFTCVSHVPGNSP